MKLLATVLETLATVSEKILHDRPSRTVWGGERRFICCQLGPGTDRNSPSECPRVGTERLGLQGKPSRPADVSPGRFRPSGAATSRKPTYYS